ncbi:hypothetical protein CWR48_14040 [Oceanobacillus arenosus]|uniref:Uncharacterized protein n=1 Tax=Oceanobacillus arenosus TaxID=1229153 RepID=A0A3D8PND8_9BACI|nr:hypothetical protein [Oceanobacillus arenosus]RDW17630.1 hypothetical protein CWR48_14040 [Oceanobacillus arenosus]
MKYEVIARFIDKNTKVLHEVGHFYETDNENRANLLREKGFIKVIDEVDGDNILDGNIEDIKKSLDGVDEETLKELLNEEKANKDRKGVIEYIKGLIEVGDE